MVYYSKPNLDRTFAALADPTRRAILAQLTAGDATVGELAAPFHISQPAISRHLKIKTSAAPQARRREGLKPNGRDGKDGTGRSP